MDYNSDLYFDIKECQYPIVYHEKYNVSVGGLEKMHVFDAKKWQNVQKGLKEHGFLDDELVKPLEATKEDLLVVHTRRYLRSLKWSYKVAMIAEVPLVACLPNSIVQRCYLKPMRLQVGGSILAGKLALERGWAINIGGGFHHCSKDKGGGFCPYADITLLLTFLMDRGMVQTAMIVDLDAHQCSTRPGGFCPYADITQLLTFLKHRGMVQRAMIVDLDAHQGNGYEHDFIDNKNIYIMDMYNYQIYPRDKAAKAAIRRKVEVRSGIEDSVYLNKLRTNLRDALDEFTPDILVYNAGTDVLCTDPLGLMNITREGIIQRDQFVFEMCKQRRVPIVMLTSGGYLRETATIISDSIVNLTSRGLIGRRGDNAKDFMPIGRVDDNA